MFHDKSRGSRTGKPTSAFSSSVHTLLVAVPVARSRPVQSQCEENPGTGSSENPGLSLHLEGPAVSHKAVQSGYQMCLVKGAPQNICYLLHEPERLVQEKLTVRAGQS